MNEHGYCPGCKADWDGGPIPDSIKEHYTGTKWGRQILYEDPYVYDGIIAVKCPDCNEMFPYGVGNLKVSKEDQRTVFEKWQEGDYYVD